jgi:single-strand DNA-binding protein
MNKVILVGNLTRDPELSTIANGTSVCKFAVAVNRNFTTKDGARETDFFNVTAWRQLGERVAKYVKKGNKVGIVGEIQTRTYEKDGQKMYATDIIASDVEFLTPKGDGSASETSGMTPITDDSLPF